MRQADSNLQINAWGQTDMNTNLAQRDILKAQKKTDIVHKNKLDNWARK